MQLKEKVAVVTGASGDIGRKILEQFSEEGADIYALVRDTNKKDFVDFTENRIKIKIR